MEVADSEDAQAVSCIFKHAAHNRDVDLTTVRSVPSSGRASQITKEVETAGRRLAEL